MSEIEFSTLASYFPYLWTGILKSFFFFFAAVTLGCIPSCGPNADCQKNDGLPKCVCNFGYQGDGYNCTGSRERQSLGFLLLFTLLFNLHLF